MSKYKKTEGITGDEAPQMRFVKRKDNFVSPKIRTEYYLYVCNNLVCANNEFLWWTASTTCYMSALHEYIQGHNSQHVKICQTVSPSTNWSESWVRARPCERGRNSRGERSWSLSRRHVTPPPPLTHSQWAKWAALSAPWQQSRKPPEALSVFPACSLRPTGAVESEGGAALTCDCWLTFAPHREGRVSGSLGRELAPERGH